MRDIKSKVGFDTSIAPAAARTTSTNGTGSDVRGFEGVAVVFIPGTITDGTHTPSVEVSDASGSGYAAAPAADLLGTLSALASNTNQRVGYIGLKRYVRAVVTVAGSPSTGGVYAAVVAKSYSSDQPVA